MNLENIHDYENLSEILGEDLGGALYAAVKKLRQMEKERLLELAEAQFTGFSAARSDESIESLTSSMGLSEDEWRLIKDRGRTGLSITQKEDVDCYFEELELHTAEREDSDGK